jgi:small conductance mechanosensitive channel
VDLTAGIGYGDDMDKARQVLEELVAQHPKVLKDPAPTIKVVELADSSVNFVVRPWVNTPDYWDVYFDLTRGIKEALDKNGISIPFPQRDVHLFQAQN